MIYMLTKKCSLNLKIVRRDKFEMEEKGND